MSDQSDVARHLSGDALAMERVLSRLGIHAQVREGVNMRCPMPDHEDRNPSCTPRVSQGLWFCQAGCGMITAARLVEAYGQAANPAEAMKTLEEWLGIDRIKAQSPQRPKAQPVDDPSLSVQQYLAIKALPARIADEFALADARIWITAKHPLAEYEAGEYTSVFMPYLLRDLSDARPRFRSRNPEGKIKWVNEARLPGKQAKSSFDQLPQCAYGLAQLSAQDKVDIVDMADGSTQRMDAPPFLLVVEGESDVHALHAMGITSCVGIPGTGMASDCAPHTAAAVRAVAAQLGVAISDVTVIVWQEQGSASNAKAAEGFPARVSQSTVEHLMAQGELQPRFQTLRAADLPGSPDDPSELWLERKHGAAAIIMQAVAQLADAPKLAADLETAAATASDAGAASVRAVSRAVEAGDAARPGADPWGDAMEQTGAPTAATAPLIAEGQAGKYVRTARGWTHERVSAKGDTTYTRACSPVVVDEVLQAGDDMLIVLRTHTPASGWTAHRVEAACTGDGGRMAQELTARGVEVNVEKRALSAGLIGVLARRMQEQGAVRRVPASTGWMGTCGTSPFGGVEVEPVDDFGAEMFRANEKRRQLRPDEEASAQAWWALASQALSAVPAGRQGPEHAAPFLALGAAAAGPLVGPLADVQVGAAPVVWLAGLGGGGKTRMQALAASIFAPQVPGMHGQSAYFANANMTPAALQARVSSCRDLPLILDDVTQMPPEPGSQRKGDDARLEAAASLGMQVFNRMPRERATREGTLRKSKALRSTALLSAEISLNTPGSRATITAGHRRRITTIEARPMTDRGLTGQWAGMVDNVSAAHGGAPGALVIKHIRQLVADRKLRPVFDEVLARVREAAGEAQVTPTQLESIAVQGLGFILLAQAGGWTHTFALESFAAAAGPYLQASAAEGGATSDDDLQGVRRVLEAVQEVVAINPSRIGRSVDGLDEMADGTAAPSYSEMLGREITAAKDGKHRVVLFTPGMRELELKHGISKQMIESAVASGVAQRRYKARIFRQNLYGVAFLLDEKDWPQGTGGEDNEPPKAPEPAPSVDDGFERGLRSGFASEPAPAEVTDTSEWPDTPEPAEPEPAAPASAPYATLRLRDNEGTPMRQNLTFDWSRGRFTSIEEITEDDRAFVREDALADLAALQDMYRDNDEVEVAGLPEADDPRWLALDNSIGYMDDFFNEAGIELGRSQDKTLSDADRVYHEQQYVKLYRLHVLGRYRQPDEFIDVVR